MPPAVSSWPNWCWTLRQSTGDLAGPPVVDEDWLVLSTIHSAKGLEWKAVYLIHASDGNLPADMATGSDREIEEELRLTYVALTRACDFLYVLWPLRYYTRSNGLSDRHSYAQPCRFFTEAVKETMDCLATRGRKQNRRCSRTRPGPAGHFQAHQRDVEVGGRVMGEIRIGITSWTEPTLIAGGHFYPSWAHSAEARLHYYSSQFPIVEVDSTYYGLPEQRTSGLWVERTPDNFIFDIKAFRLFTQHPTSPAVLPKDIREALTADLKSKKSLYYHDLPAELTAELWKRFEEALLPLDSAGKLGVVLFQFPPWFYPGNEQRDYISACQEKLPQYRLAIEFRHNSWVNEKNYQRTFSFLKDNKLSYVCVDEPQGFKNSVPPVGEATSEIGVVRFHGRKTELWEKGSTEASGRFDYLYSEDELQEWEPKIKTLADNTRQLHVLFNNCYDDKAVRNARQIRAFFD